jgi:hypothetical protein
MFKTLYRCVRTAARHENGPAARSRLAYLENLAAGGATLHCLRANAGVLYRTAVCMNLDDTSLVQRGPEGYLPKLVSVISGLACHGSKPR